MKFELNAKGISTTTVAMTDYKMISAKVARVMLSFTGNPSKEEIVASLSQQFKHLAEPVAHSFRVVKAGAAVGYVRATTPIRAVEEKELRAGYQVMASNILMDNADKSLWEVHTGVGGTYLARHGNEDLSELAASVLNPRSNVPRLANLAQASVAKREFVAFASDSGDMDYGFCVASNAAKGLAKVVSIATRQPVVIKTEAIASVIPTGPNGLQIPRDTHEKITASGISRADAEQEIAYYQKLYSYDQDYLDQVIEQVEGTATL